MVPAMMDRSDQTRLGLIAGAGKFPLMVLEGAKRSGCHVTVIALRGFADGSLAEKADVFRWAGLARLGRWIRILKRNHAQSVILAGAVRKTSMYGRWRLLRLLPDWTSFRLWFFRLRDKRNDSVLGAVASEFARHGIIMQDCIQYTAEHLAPQGVLTRVQPSESQRKDAEFGWRIAKELGRLDIGQAVAVKETEVVAVEAIEGTDRMIERSGLLVPRGGWTMVKVSKPDQDMRFDVPTVGPETVANLAKHGARMLVIEAGRTILVDKEAMIAAADRLNVAILSLK